MQKQDERAVYDAARGRAIQKARVMIYDVREGGPKRYVPPTDFAEDQEIKDDPPVTPAQ
ncbi:MAG TPA: hypothetical protein VF735_05270 [Pyrinomonadaceae bacterium]